MNSERLFTVIQGPHFSEKTALGAEKADQYGFRVSRDANKLEIKKAVEKLFNVNVKKVQVINVKGKAKRNRYGVAKRPDWKKAYVRLEQGQIIDFSVID